MSWLSKTWKKVTKTVKKTVKKVTKTVTKTWDDVKEFSTETWHTINGDYQEEVENLAKEQDLLDTATNDFNDFADSLNSSFMDEIFDLSNKRQLKEASDDLQKKYDDYDAKVKEFEEDFKMFNSFSAHNPLAQTFLSTIRITGGLVHAFTEFIHSDGTLNDFRDLAGTILGIVGNSILIVAGGVLIAIPGLQVVGVLMVAAGIAGLVSLIVSLDGKFAGGALMGVALSSLDFAFNDVLHLDSVIEEFGWLDRDNAHYAQLVSNVSLAITVTSISLSIASGIGILNLPAGSAAANVVAESFKATGTISSIYNVVTQAFSINDIVEGYKKLDDLKEELKDEELKLDERIRKDYADKITRSYRQMENLLTDDALAVENYKLLVFYNPTMVLDPELLILGDPDSKARFVSPDNMRFGYEDMFNYSTMGGGDDYVNSAIFRT